MKPSEVEVSAVSNVNSKIKQHRRKYDAKKSEGQDTFLLDTICDEKGYGVFSVVLHYCMHAVMKLSNDCDEFLRVAIFFHDSQVAVAAYRFKRFSQINISRGQCSVPDTSLAEILLQTPFQESHAPYGSRIDSPVRVHVRDGC